MEKLKIPYPILVEGKYDKIKLVSIVDALIITSDGFGIFKSDEKRTLLRKLSERSKLIVLSDSDSAGMLIRSCVKGMIPSDRIINLYTPQVRGKEKRKQQPSREGYVGVEGIDVETLRRLLEPYAGEVTAPREREITKADMYALGLSGTGSASQRRAYVCERLELPRTLTANALMEAADMICGYEGLKEICEQLDALG